MCVPRLSKADRQTVLSGTREAEPGSVQPVRAQPRRQQEIRQSLETYPGPVRRSAPLVRDVFEGRTTDPHGGGPPYSSDFTGRYPCAEQPDESLPILSQQNPPFAWGSLTRRAVQISTTPCTDSGVGSRTQKSEIKRGINPQSGKRGEVCGKGRNDARRSEGRRRQKKQGAGR